MTGARWLTLLGCWLALSASALAAQVAGTVTQLSGPLLDKKADGSVKILSLKSEVESGDTLVTEKNTYALLKFVDNSEITLKPGTTFKIDNFAFDEGKPGGDSASFSLVKGGLRSVTGLLGKRNREKFEMKTPSATIGIRGTTFIADLVEPSAAAVAAADQARLNFLLASTAALDQAAPIQPLPPAPPGALALPPSLQGQQPGTPPAGPIQPTAPVPQVAPPVAPPTLPGAGGQQPGLYIQVLDGLVSLTNQGGAKVFSAGQFGFTPNPVVPPVVLPQNPGLKFNPPPVFNASSAPSVKGGSPDQSNKVDCIVR